MNIQMCVSDIIHETANIHLKPIWGDGGLQWICHDYLRVTGVTNNHGLDFSKLLFSKIKV